MENDSSGKAERENYETQNDCSTAFRNPAVLGSWMRKRSSDRQEHRSIVVSARKGIWARPAASARSDAEKIFLGTPRALPSNAGQQITRA